MENTLKKKNKKIGQRVQYNSARRQPWTRTEPEVSCTPVHGAQGKACVLSLSLLDLFVWTKEDIAI